MVASKYRPESYICFYICYYIYLTTEYHINLFFGDTTEPSFLNNNPDPEEPVHNFSA